MVSDYYSVIDSVSTLLDPKGIIAVVDFYGTTPPDEEVSQS